MLERKTLQAGGFTKIDLIIVLCTIALLAGLLLPALQTTKPRSSRINCISNVKQVGLALRMFTNDHEDQFPWNAPIEKGGTRGRGLNGEPTIQFLALTNELASPKVLVCTTDLERAKISNFSKLTR